MNKKPIIKSNKTRRLILINLLLSAPLLIITSCASYNYSSTNDRTLKITSDNLSDFQVFSTKSSNKLNTASSGSVLVTIESLKKKHLSLLLTHPNYDPQLIIVKRSVRPKALTKDIGLGVFTFGIPIIIDVFNSDLYKVSYKSKELNIHFEFKQSFMSDELAKIRNTKNPDEYIKWISSYPKSSMMQVALDAKDSLELNIALDKETELAIDEYISSHQTSTFLPQATKIKEEMVVARKLFEQTKIDNSVQAYENFLQKFPRSLHNTDAHRRLVDVAEKAAISSMNSSKMISYVNNYLIPNYLFLNQSELDQKKVAISKAIDVLLVKENVKSDPKKSYEYYSNLWKAYNSVLTQVSVEYLSSFDQVLTFRPKIADILFNKLKEANTAEKQSVLTNKINNDFPQFELWEKSKNVLITIIEELSKVSGSVKLFNVGFLPYYFENMSERNPLIGRSFYKYKGAEYESLKGITYEEITILNGKLNGVSKAFKGSVVDFEINMRNNGVKEISYYRYGTLALTVFFPTNSKEYYYEYENGSNLTLKIFSDVMSELGVIEKNTKNYAASKNYSLVESEIKRITSVYQPAVDLVKINPLPQEYLNQVISKVNSLIALAEKIKQNVEQEQRLAQQKYQRELEKKQAEENAQLKSLLNQTCSCECCGKSFVRQNGWFFEGNQVYKLIEPSGTIFAGQLNTMYTSLQIAYNYSPSGAMKQFKYCSKICAQYCK